jgi:hypothetical protein
MVADRIGGLSTVFMGSAWQTLTMTAFLLTQNEAGLFTIAAAFGLGLSGIIPAYVLAVCEQFPSSDASWRIPTLLLSAAVAWAPVAGSLGCFTAISGIICPHLPPSSAPMHSISS